MQADINNIRERIMRQAISFNKYWNNHKSRLEQKTTEELLCLIHPEERIDFRLELNRFQKNEMKKEDKIIHLHVQRIEPKHISEITGINLTDVYRTIKIYNESKD